VAFRIRTNKKKTFELKIVQITYNPDGRRTTVKGGYSGPEWGWG